MKKFLMMLVALVAAISVSAQTYVKPNVFDNTYVQVTYGVTALTHPNCLLGIDWSHSLAQQSGLQVGKYITPKFGVALDGVVSWDTFSCTKLSDYTVPFVTVSALAKYRFVDTHKLAFTAVAGPGWAHYFVKDGTDLNGLMTKFQVEFTYKATDRLGIVVAPEFNYNLTNFYGNGNQPYFDSRNSWYGLNVGVSYRLGDKFKECPYKYTQGDVDHLNATINDLRAALAQKPNEVVKTVVEKSVVVEGVDNSYTVLFAKSSDVVGDVTAVASALNKSDKPVVIVGGTSPEGTEAYNKSLAISRAEAVKAALVKAGVDASRISISTDYSSQRRATIIVGE